MAPSYGYTPTRLDDSDRMNFTYSNPDARKGAGVGVVVTTSRERRSNVPETDIDSQ